MTDGGEISKYALSTRIDRPLLRFNNEEAILSEKLASLVGAAQVEAFNRSHHLRSQHSTVNMLAIRRCCMTACGLQFAGFHMFASDGVDWQRMRCGSTFLTSLGRVALVTMREMRVPVYYLWC